MPPPDSQTWSRRIRSLSARRSKSMPRTTPTLRLPDSAISGTTISGTTIGGHRHMAISIPLSASEPRSQYPVYHDDDQHQLRLQRLSGVGTTKPFDYIGGLPIDEPVELAAPERRGRRTTTTTTTTTTTMVGEVPIVTTRPGSAPTRRDVVRDRKRRDVEALLAHRPGPCSNNSSDENHRGSSGQGTLALSPVMTVLDVHPDYDDEDDDRLENNNNNNNNHHHHHHHHNNNNNNHLVGDMPTPPVSLRGSPSRGGERRLRDVERRVRRLERNADVWLRALLAERA
ncbi:hypothetical protein GQ602_006179 [Ophiocordyceps camponoti-floridani]|uniref:Uncharacterized protein n=1 Tax=Ophiocordyceps camponoti-floridani TaxID=2030778 RepID=A0A8H4Q2N5_9HYPO|nr:hypothetical protein GQ602_006179 [Ophiocordyceps camponoti-floridani]